MIHNIVFATDQNYIRHLSVALISLLSTNKGLNFKIHIINGGIEKEAWQKLKQIIVGYKAELLDICIDDSIFEKLTTNHHFTKANYYRLLIPEFIAADKVLYLDADIVVNDSIEELYNTDLEDYYVGAVESPGFTGHAALKMAKNSKYFNSGVMLINNCKWRKKSLCNKVVNFVDKNEPAIQFVDQCGLNGVVNGHWKMLPLKFNQQALIFEERHRDKCLCFSKIELKEAKENPVIIHYSGSSKPWHLKNEHPYKSLYWKYLRMTPFKKYFPDDLTVINVIRWMIPNKLKELIQRT